MKLIEAVRLAREREHQWVGIDGSSAIFSYKYKPSKFIGKPQWAIATHSACLFNYLGRCETPLTGTWENWLFNVNQITEIGGSNN